MLARIQRKANLLALLLGMQSGAATLENSMEVTQKVKNTTTLPPSNYTPEYLPKGTKIWGTCTQMFTATLSTMTKLWKDPKHPSTDEWIKKIWYASTMEYYTAIKRMKSCHLQ